MEFAYIYAEKIGVGGYGVWFVMVCDDVWRLMMRDV